MLFIEEQVPLVESLRIIPTWSWKLHSEKNMKLKQFITLTYGVPYESVVKNTPVNAAHTGSSPGLEDPLEKEMATHSSILAWKIPRTEEPGGLPSTGLQRGGHDSATEHENDHTPWSQGREA